MAESLTMETTKVGSARVNMSIDSPASNTTLVVNEWDQQNTDTINKWQTTIKMTSFVYGDVLDKYTTYITNGMIINAVLGALSVAASGISVALGSFNNQWAVVGLTIFILLCSAGVTISTFARFMGGWDEKVRNYTIYCERLSALWMELRSEMDIDSSERLPATVFISRLHGQYMNLISQGPYIAESECKAALSKYKSNSSNNFAWNSKYDNNNIAIELP
jgi:hypothetical protein